MKPFQQLKNHGILSILTFSFYTKQSETDVFLCSGRRIIMRTLILRSFSLEYHFANNILENIFIIFQEKGNS